MSSTQRKIASLIQKFTHEAEPRADAELLIRFARSQDEAAFAALVERHGPMVLGVCRRVLDDVHTAEDAFQAAFLALAQHAARVRSTGSLAAWLYGTAVRVSLKARRTAARSRAIVGRIPCRTSADPLAEITGRELVAVVDEELARLPESFRVVVVLCCLEGLSQEEAAQRLGWTPGSVKGRLERGRERLREQLARRDLVLPVGLGAVLVGSRAEAVPPALFARAVSLAGPSAATPSIAGLAVAAAPAKTLPALAVVVLFALTAGGIAVLGNPAQSDNPPVVKSAAADQPQLTAAVDRYEDPLPSGAVLRIGTTRLRHPEVFSLAFTAEKKLASIGRDYIVRVWDPATGQQLRERAFEMGPPYPSWGGCLSPDARRLALQRGDRMKVFDTESGRELASVALTDSRRAVAQFSLDSGQLAVVDEDNKLVCRVLLCDIGANSVRELAKNEGFQQAAFSRDGQRLALAQGFDGASVWDIASGRELMRFKPQGIPIGCVDFDATGEVLAILGAINLPQSFNFIRVSTGQPADGWVVPPAGGLEWVRFSPDGSTILMAGWKTALHWFDPKTGKTTRTATEPVRVPPAFSTDGQVVATARENTLDIWDAATGRSVIPKHLGNTPQEEIHGVAASPDGKWLLTKDGETGLIQIWDTSGQLKGSLKSNRWGGRYPLFSADGRHLFGVAPDAIALVRWEFPGGAETKRYTFAEPATDQVYVYHFGLSVDGRRLAAITQTANRPAKPALGGGPARSEVATITVWDAATGHRLESREVEGLHLLLGYGAFSPELRWYYSGDRPIPLGDDSEYRLELPAKWSSWQAAVSSDGRLVAQLFIGPQADPSDDRTRYRIVVHEAATGKQVLVLPSCPSGPIAFTPDNRNLIVTAPDAIFRWDLVTLKAVLVHPFPGRANGSYGQSFASSLAVTPDGTRALTGHIDTTAVVWELTPPARRVRPLSEKELAAAWGELSVADAGKAFTAVWTLADGGPEVVPFLRTRLKPVAAPSAEESQKLVMGLNAAEFADRETSTKALREHGDAVIHALREAMKGGLSAEQLARIEPLLTAAKQWVLKPGDRLRQMRAVAILEQIGTVDARDVLTRLAGGLPDARLTREAAAAIERLPPRGR